MATNTNYGEWAFLAGVALSVIVGVASGVIGVANMPYVIGILVLLGLIVGIMNIHDKEVTSFLIASIALIVVLSSVQPFIVIMGNVGPMGVTLGGWINTFLVSIASFISPAAFVVALKAIHNHAKE